MSAVTGAHPAVTAIGVVVPARDEERLLPACLDALTTAADRVQAVCGTTVDLLVVLDRCVDGSAGVVAARPRVRSLSLDVGTVGLARAAGLTDVVSRHGLLSQERQDLWLATTDADSTVPPDWLVRQVELASSGADVVLGTVDVDDWSEHPAHVEQRWRSSYDPRDGHPHVHGANVGLRAEVYLAVGGFPGLALEEDVSMVTRLGGYRVVRSGSIPVVTSARATGRLSGGFADHVAALG